jgi:hypothetical protein
VILEIENMSSTVPSYGMTSEIEKRKWKVFREQLDKSEMKLFDEMMSYPRLYNVAGIGACKPVLIQPMLMSIIFEHYKRINEIKGETQNAQKGV